ncbi:MAG: YwiC-like family protein [Acidobacteriota bacterium]
MSGPAARLRSALRGAWGEHGAWAVLLVSFGAGVILAWPAGHNYWLLLPSLSLLTAAKGMTQRARRTGRGWLGPSMAGILGTLLALPAVASAPVPYAVLALLAAPFLATYFSRADSPAWTRSLPVELYGTALLASSAGLGLLGPGRPGPRAALLAWLLVGSLFLPGVLRARLPKRPVPILRISALGLALGGAAVVLLFATENLIAPWGGVAAVSFLEDAFGALSIPRWTTKRLGVTLTVKSSAAALLLALAWRLRS